MGGLIAVGVDGSDSSVDALHWAVAQARLTGASLEVATAWELPTSYGWANSFCPLNSARRQMREMG